MILQVKPTGILEQPITKIEQIVQKFTVNSQTGCWDWTGHITSQGYGSYHLRPRNIRAYRLVYELVTGRAADPQLILDHLCRNRACVNPKHLELVDNRTNILRGVGATAQNAKKTHCIYGHPLFGDNLYRTKLGRLCKQCMLRNTRGWRARVKKAKAESILKEMGS